MILRKIKGVSLFLQQSLDFTWRGPYWMQKDYYLLCLSLEMIDAEEEL